MQHPRRTTKRVTFRLTDDEYRWLSQKASQGGYETLSAFLKALLRFGILSVLREGMADGLAVGTGELPDAISQEIHMLFEECEAEGLRRCWAADVNGRR